MCKSKRSSSRRRSKSRNRATENENKLIDRSHEKKNVHEVESSDVLDCGEIILINEVTAEGRQSIMAKLNAKPKHVKCRVRLAVKADTGANGNVLPIRCLKQMYPWV